ncbi:MAG: hypothetical protein VXX84_01145 [Candidatus Thermoplasmatota archaeon]|jgi:hypothetical protein|nr:hypothetical protein [Candidatus Thermoplasmatota archaeon]MEC7349991.1 hypothetical protein [Candidatus Thermoplasmatota archaeon]MEC7494201.1 hypothetical protein [Candidatus Thermoplasmatota archaeon]MEC7697650.1 hypothetical protein [Candidatus Thermoplasmatota archaeon]MEC7976881.1 hypothetical protein [Candidatus Thermoplasmatota archaeon]|tara:strand:- start:64 stop:249 length:186 start_codon:yes stop_codon:yes gene_type:complete
MALLIRKLFSSLSVMIGLVLILSWFYWADSPYFLLLLGLTLLLIGIGGVVTTIAKAEEELE